MQELYFTYTLFTQNEFRIFEYQDKAFKKSISIDFKESATCRFKPEATLYTQELLWRSKDLHLHCENFIRNNGLYKGATFEENDVFPSFFLP